MVSYDSIWLSCHMALYDLLWIYGSTLCRMIPYSFIWLNMDPLGSIWLHMATHCSKWLRLAPFFATTFMDSSIHKCCSKETYFPKFRIQCTIPVSWGQSWSINKCQLIKILQNKFSSRKKNSNFKLVLLDIKFVVSKGF